MVISLDYQIQLPVFEGPLDLLLQLIEREELDITTIALAKVTDQYMDYLAEIERRQAKDLADFLAVAAKLMLIKSAALLSRPSELTPDAEEVGDELIYQLQIYKRFKEIATLLHKREEEGLHSYVRIAPMPRLDPQLDLDGVTSHNLVSIVQEALDRIPAPPVDDVVVPPSVTISEQIDLIERQLTRRNQIRFREILSRVATRVEIIVTLLAVLELVKQNRARVRQKEIFGEVIIEHQIPAETTPADAAAASPAT